MTEQYPFFRDEDERTQAVIGEEAVRSDLEGTYQKPYAVLTQRRLYCKNEQGNFITEANTLQSAQNTRLQGQNWFLWVTLACLAVAVFLFCFNYLGDSWTREHIRYDAQEIIENYHALEAVAETSQAELDRWDEMEAEIEKYEKEAEKQAPDYQQAQVEVAAINETISAYKKDISAQQQEIRRLEQAAQAELDKINKDADSRAEEISTIRSNISSTKSKIASEKSSQNKYIQDVEGGKITTWVDWAPYRVKKGDDVYTRVMNGYEDRISGLEKKLKDLEAQLAPLEEADASASEAEAEQAKAVQEQRDQAIAVCEKEIDAIETEIQAWEEKLGAYSPTIEAYSEIQNQIAQQKALQEEIDCDGLRDSIQQFKDSEKDYAAAQRVLRRLNVIIPWGLVLVVALLVAALIFTIIKRVKQAVLLAWATGLSGIVLVWWSDVSLPNSRYDYGHFFVPVFILGLIAATVVTFVLGMLALRWDTKRTVFQITHAAGVFHFKPSLYPAEELARFEAQVKAVKDGGDDGQ